MIQFLKLTEMYISSMEVGLRQYTLKLDVSLKLEDFDHNFMTICFFKKEIASQTYSPHKMAMLSSIISIAARLESEKKSEKNIH